MSILIAGLVIFVGGHLFGSLARDTRESLIKRFGAVGYKAAYSLIALLGLILIVKGWKAMGPGAPLYISPQWLYTVTYLLVWPAFVLLAAAYLPAGNIAAVTKHPMTTGVKFWALAHILVNGELRSLILFGTLLAWAVITRIAAKKRGDTGREAGKGAMNDLLAIGVGTAAYITFFIWLHPLIAGVSLL